MRQSGDHLIEVLSIHARRWPAILLALPVVAACAHIRTSVTPFGETTAAPKPVDYPIHLYGSQPPSCPYVELGLVTVQGSRHKTDKILEVVRSEARKMGGDAVIGLAEGSVTTGLVPAGYGAAAVQRKRVSGTVIAFKDSTCTH